MHNETLRPESTPDELVNFRPLVQPVQHGLTKGTLVDKYGRRITYVRLSITDRCDFRCTYCMGEEMTFLPRNAVMSLEECLKAGRGLVAEAAERLARLIKIGLDMR